MLRPYPMEGEKLRTKLIIIGVTALIVIAALGYDKILKPGAPPSIKEISLPSETAISHTFEQAPEGWAKITDFGVSQQAGSSRKGFFGTTRYLSRDVALCGQDEGGLTAHSSLDIDVLGRLAYELFTLSPFFEALNFRGVEFLKGRKAELESALAKPDSSHAASLTRQIMEEGGDGDLQKALESTEGALENFTPLEEKSGFLAVTSALIGVCDEALISAEDPLLVAKNDLYMSHMIAQCTSIDPSSRPTATELLNEIKNKLGESPSEDEDEALPEPMEWVPMALLAGGIVLIVVLLAILKSLTQR